MAIQRVYISCAVLLLSNYAVTATPFHHDPGVPVVNPEPVPSNITAISSPPSPGSDEIVQRLQTIVRNAKGEGNSTSSYDGTTSSSSSPSSLSSPSTTRTTTTEEVATSEEQRGYPSIWKLVVGIVALIILVVVAGILIFSFTILFLLLITWRFQNLLGKMFAPIMLWKVIMITLGFWDGIRIELLDVDGDNDELRKSNKDKFCNALVPLYSYGIVTHLAWLVVINFNFWLDLGRKCLTRPDPNSTIRAQQERKKYLKYSLFGWGVPIPLLGASLGMNKLFWIQTQVPPMANVTMESTGEIARLTCYSGVPQYVWPSLVVFWTAILAFSMLTMKSIREQQLETKFARESRTGSNVSNFQLFWKLSVFMGLEIVLRSVLDILFNRIAPSRKGKYGGYSWQGGYLLFFCGSSVVTVLSYISSACLLHFFLWSKRELVTGQVKQVFQDCWTWMGSCVRKAE